jgi:3-dehydro-L-gulonate-6-phosphate decarboxylase
MKLQVVFNSLDLEKDLIVAQSIMEFVDQITIGQLLLFKYGLTAITRFRETLPQSRIIADTKIIEFCKDSAKLNLDAGADWITVLAGANQNIIHSTCTTAHNLGKRVMLDLIDARSRGQSALEAKSYGADAIIFHQPHDDYDEFTLLDEWDMIKGNADLPIYISAKINRDNIQTITNLAPAGIIVGKAITQDDDPVSQAQYFRQLVI